MANDERRQLFIRTHNETISVERVKFLWILMLDHSLALRLKNRTVGYLV
jgi:hypothetical protein